MTLAAASAGVAQSVASRKLAALERHLGVTLVDRVGRQASISRVGQELLPSARRLVQLADSIELDAERVRARPLLFGVPDFCADRALAVLAAAPGAANMPVALYPTDLRTRSRLVDDGQVGAALLPVPEDEAMWRIPLGVASRSALDVARVSIGDLRPTRGALAPQLTLRLAGRRLVLLPEDDVPHIRGVLERVAAGAGLRPDQVTVAYTRHGALAAVLADDDLLLSSRGEAEAVGMAWVPLANRPLQRGYAVVSTSHRDGDRLRAMLGQEIAACLGAR